LLPFDEEGIGPVTVIWVLYWNSAWQAKAVVSQPKTAAAIRPGNAPRTKSGEAHDAGTVFLTNTDSLAIPLSSRKRSANVASTNSETLTQGWNRMDLFE
jgi:hypothetical protein